MLITFQQKPLKKKKMKKKKKLKFTVCNKIALLFLNTTVKNLFNTLNLTNASANRKQNIIGLNILIKLKKFNLYFLKKKRYLIIAKASNTLGVPHDKSGKNSRQLRGLLTSASKNPASSSSEDTSFPFEL